jgi:2-keto-4-pentenoate hydratase/2-oxohepta-3-ene-1,7-dioic acid hydratase in catechol pathway
MTLGPGDIILTGTPSGVGATTGTFLRPGDTMVAEVEGLGSLTTPVVAD